MDGWRGPARVFPFRLVPWLPGRYATGLRWLRHLLERLGREPTLAIWQDAAWEDDQLLQDILEAGWDADVDAAAADLEVAIEGAVARLFPVPIEGIAAAEARRLVEQMPPLAQVRRAFPSPAVRRTLAADEALHLTFHGVAGLAEAVIRHHGKQGELIAYDIQRADRQEQVGSTGTVAELLAELVAAPPEASLFSVGLETELVRASADEVVLNVTDCAWARYFRARHPTVGYLLACSTDEVAYRAFNDGARLRRTATIMEGAPACDFRIFGAPDASTPAGDRQVGRPDGARA